MRFFEPVFEYVAPTPGPSGAADRVGGLPGGHDAGRWPRCAECGATMSHIAQFLHRPDRLDLGAEGRYLSLWQCEHRPGMCETWSPTSGANAAVVSEVVPAARAVAAAPPGTLVYPEARVVRWVEGDDAVPPERIADYLSEERYRGLDDEGWQVAGFDTRIGGVPTWLQSADEAPLPPWQYVGQISDSQRFLGPPPDGISGAFGVQRRVGDGWVHERPPGRDVQFWITVEGDGWYLPGPNFGFGMAYVFLNPETDPPAAQMFWQR